MGLLKQIIKILPGGRDYLDRQAYEKDLRNLAPLGDAENRFTHIFKNDKWKGGESKSGPGSTVDYTHKLRAKLPELLQKLAVKKFLDAPCGDYNWFQHIDRTYNFSYTGGDIVRDLVDLNNKRYANENTRFIHLNIIKDKLPEADLWMCRDCLFHLSYEDIFSTLNNFVNSNIKYLLATTHPKQKRNKDIPTGAFRELNLEIAPFNLPKADLYLDDWIEGVPVRQLALWKHETIQKHLAQMNNRS